MKAFETHIGWEWDLEAPGGHYEIQTRCQRSNGTWGKWGRPRRAATLDEARELLNDAASKSVRSGRAGGVAVNTVKWFSFRNEDDQREVMGGAK